MQRTHIRTPITKFLVLTITIGLLSCAKKSPTGTSSQVSKDATRESPSRVTSESVPDIRRMAEAVSKDIATVGQSQRGTRGIPILILEEAHTSRAGQIEQAIALVRLHDQYGLRDIALEGYLRERPAITTAWFKEAARGLTLYDRASVAARLLREGEISAAEFMTLAYDDISLHPIETIREHAVELAGEASTIPFTYLLKIAQRSLRESHVPTLQALQRDIEQADADHRPERAKEMLDFVLSVDPWTREKGKSLADPNHIRSATAETMLAEIQEIDQRARSLNVDLEQKERQAMKENLAFWQGRAAASRTMVAETGKIADRSDVRLVALNIGAAHTEGMAAMLTSERRPYSVIRPLALEAGRAPQDLDLGSLDRKYKSQSVFGEGLSVELLKAFPVQTQKKPEPILNQPWFQAKSELYLFTSKITRRVLEGGAGGGGQVPAGPPFGFSDDDLRGARVFIDPRRIEKNENEGAVLFPAVLDSGVPTGRREIWVKAALNEAFVAPVSSSERQNVETMLRRHLEEVRKESQPLKAAEDAAGRIQIDVRTVATMAASRQEALRITLTTR